MSVTADDVYDVRFGRAVLGNRGYHEPQVDAFLNRVAATLEGEDDITAAEVHSVSFARPPLGKRGYDQAEVDAFLRLVESTLAERAGDPAAGFFMAPALEHTHARKPRWRRIRT